MSEMKKDAKDASISFIRLMAMSFIVACHFLQYYDNGLAWWFNVGVQIFLCISGFLYGQKEISDSLRFIEKNFVKILVDYYIVIIISAIFYRIFHPELISKAIFLNMVLCRETIQGMGHLWFISAILFCYLITPFLYRLMNKLEGCSYHQGLFVYILLLIICHLVIEKHLQYIMAPAVICYMVGFFLGRLKKNSMKNRFFHIFLANLIIALLMNSLQIYIDHFHGNVFKFIDTKSNLYISFCDYAHVSLGILIFTLLYIALRNIHFNRFRGILKASDKYSFDVYLIHQIFILGPFCMENITAYPFFNIILILTIVSILAFALQHASNVLKRPILSRI